MNQALKLLKADAKLRNFQYTPRFELTTAFYGGAYGRVTPESKHAVELLSQIEQIHLETTYTGKTMAGMLNYAQTHQTSEKLLFWNTYNSVDLSPVAEKVDPSNLPPEFHCLFEKVKED